MSEPGDQGQQESAAAPAADSGSSAQPHVPVEAHLPTDAYPTAYPSTYPMPDPSPAAPAWETAPTYPAAAPAYPAADPYGYQSGAPPVLQQYRPGAHPVGSYQPYGSAGRNPAGYPYAVGEAPMCGLAVASLVCGIVWVYWITSILAIVFAAVALGKIQREGLRGRGLAIAGLVLGLVWMALLGLALIGFVVGGTSGVVPFAGN